MEKTAKHCIKWNILCITASRAIRWGQFNLLFTSTVYVKGIYFIDYTYMYMYRPTVRSAVKQRCT